MCSVYGEMLRTGQRGGGKRRPFPGSPGSCILILFFTFHHRYSREDAMLAKLCDAVL